MSANCDPEIILKEKYGSSSKEITYVKPADQSNIVVVESKNSIDFIENWFVDLFLPQGYPDSVSKDYTAYQIWDTAQAFCSTITGTIATQEILRGIGVGNTNITPLAATITWVLKDGCGHVGRIVFAYSHGSYLDAYSKKWRLYADTLNDAAMCIEMAIPLMNKYTTFVLCISTVMKSIVGVAGGATRAALTQHHAIRGNLADVAAKDSAQETAVNFVASFVALFILSVIGNSLLLFAIFTAFHIIFNYLAVRAVCLKTFNEPRFLQVIETYLENEIIPTPCEVNRQEPVVFYQLGPNMLDMNLCGFQITIGQSIETLLRRYRKATYIKSIKNIYSDRNYLLIPNLNSSVMHLLLKENASTDDILCGYFHAVLLSIIICTINNKNLEIYKNVADPKPFAQICQTLQSGDWTREIPQESGEIFSGFLYYPSTDLLKFVDRIVQREWIHIKGGLEKTGWYLEKHLLMADEWRLTSDCMVDIRSISVDYQDVPADPPPKPFKETLREIEANRMILKPCISTIEPDH